MDELEEMLMKYLEKIPEDLKPGEKREVTCVCGGSLIVSRASCNGHLNVSCDKCKFHLMQ